MKDGALKELEAAGDVIASHLAVADPDALTTGDAAKVLEVAARIERLAGALRLLVAKRAADGMVWRDQGHRSAATWMAETAKVPVREALEAVETASALRVLPATTEALRRGELSRAQVGLIAKAAARRPSAEGALLAAAADHTLTGLRERCAQVRAALGSAEAEARRYEAISHARYLRHWTDPDGALRLDAKLTPDKGAQVLGALAPLEKACFDEARAAGEALSPGAALADALVRLAATGPPAKKGPRGSQASPSTVVFRVDGAAFVRGYAESGETCAIPGVGPVPVAEVRRQLPEAFVKIVVADGVDIKSVVHVGRAVSAHVDTALGERDRCCVVPGCDVTHGLERHHWMEDFARCGTTSLDGLARICKWHHDLVTYEGYVLRGGPGKWEFTAPEGVLAFDTS